MEILSFVDQLFSEKISPIFHETCSHIVNRTLHVTVNIKFILPPRAETVCGFSVIFHFLNGKQQKSKLLLLLTEIDKNECS